MTDLEIPGQFVPSRILRALRVAGFDVAGVTAAEDIDGNVTAIQIISVDALDEAAVTAAVAAVGPGPDPLAALETVRGHRNEMLAGSDWTQLSDAPLTQDETSAWTTYRQQLRDLTEQDGFDPFAPAWPTAPDTPPAP